MEESVEFHAKKLHEAWSMNEAKKHTDALANAGTPGAVDALIKALEHERPGVAYWSAEALGDIGDPRAVPALIKTLKHKNFDVAFRSLNALTRIGGPAVPELINAIGHENLDIACRSAIALGDIGDKKALSALMKLTGSKNNQMNQTVKDAIKKIQEANDG